MYCTKCGRELPDSAKFCPQCGEKAARSAPGKPELLPEGFARRCKAALLAVASVLLGLAGGAMDSRAGQRLRGFRWQDSRRLRPGLIALISLALIAANWLVVTSGEEELFDFRYDLYDVIDEIAWRSDRVGGFSDAGDVREALFEISDGKISPIEWNHFCTQAAPMSWGFRRWALALGAKDTGDFDKLVAFFYGYIALFVACVVLGIATVVARFAGRSCTSIGRTSSRSCCI